MGAAKSKNLAKQTIRLYWDHAWRYKKHVIALGILVPLTVLVNFFLPPLIVANVLERLSNGDFIPNELWQSFGTDLLLYAMLVLIGGIVLWRIVVVIIWHLEGMVLRDLYRRMFDHFMQLSPAFHANNFGGSLVSQTSKFANSYIRMMDTTVFQVYTLIASMVIASALLWSRAPLFVVALLSFSIIFIATSVFVTKRVRELAAVEATKQHKVTGYLADAITNVLAVKSFSAASSEKAKFADATEVTRNAMMDVMRAATIRDIYFNSATAVIQVLALALAAVSVVLFDANIGTVFLIVTYTSNITQRLWEFSQNTLRNYNRSLGDAKDAVETLETKPSITDPEQPEEFQVKQGVVAFENVTFSHDDANQDDILFRKLSLQIAHGEKIGLVGHSGSGKTSLTKLLLRFSDVDSGEILIDGQDIAHITQDDLREAIAYVPQEPLLFHRTIKENIAYGKPDATEDDIYAAAKRANAHEFIESLPHGYETLVGERGVKLSGGQRQRVAIARALIKDAPILVLDEATSALDSESEKLIQKALRELMKGHTAIVIAHRLSTIQRMDRIVVLDKGKIIEQGSHKDLLAHKGAYAKLWAHQSGGFIEE